jgi:hypothetical protein
VGATRKAAKPESKKVMGITFAVFKRFSLDENGVGFRINQRKEVILWQ